MIVGLIVMQPDLTEKPVFCETGETIAMGDFARIISVCLAEGGKAPSFQEVDGSCQVVCVDSKEESNIDY